MNVVIKRLISSVFLIFFITLITFSVMKMDFTLPEIKVNLPFVEFQIDETKVQTGDPLADLRLNPAIPESVIEAEEKRLGLDKGFWAQYFTWIGNVLKGDFGYSQNNQKVIELMKPALLNTLLLNIVTILLTWLIALPLGVYAAVNRNSIWDKSLRILTSCLMSFPSFVLAIIGLLFALYTGLLPIGGLTSSYYDELDPIAKFFDIAAHMVLPVCILVFVGLSGLQRQMRANLLDVLREDYIRTARAKGLSENVVIYKHAVRNAINPLVTLLGYEFSSLFSSAALVEMVLAYPGLGFLTLEAARKLDINLVMANLLLGSIMLVLGNFLADYLLSKVDPRIRFSS